MQRRLKKKGIDSSIHYRVPIHKQPAYEGLGYHDVALPLVEKAAREVLSLPVHPGLSQKDLEYLVLQLLCINDSGYHTHLDSSVLSKRKIL